MNHLPGTPARQPHAPQAGQPTEHAAAIINAVEEIYAPTSYRDPNPTPTVGPTPPVTQPGRPPMSQKATDASALMLSGSVLTIAAGGATSAILWASGHADPTVVAMICGAPAVLALALARLARHSRDALHAIQPVHHHYDGATLYQDNRTARTETRAVWARSTHNH
ncbi:hypothetical protein [Streptomyces sp. NPDC008150]|uniref:hypothetical protein n=1 Tax=Streptomyces sp. NPDC008150 TaxID=3364816 RepID=UPI0036E3AE72